MLSHFSCVQLFETLWTVVCQTPLSVGFSRQGYWSWLPCPSPGYLPDPRIKPISLRSPASECCTALWGLSHLVFLLPWFLSLLLGCIVSEVFLCPLLLPSLSFIGPFNKSPVLLNLSWYLLHGRPNWHNESWKAIRPPWKNLLLPVWRKILFLGLDMRADPWIAWVELCGSTYIWIFFNS